MRLDFILNWKLSPLKSSDFNPIVSSSVAEQLIFKDFYILDQVNQLMICFWLN